MTDRYFDIMVTVADHPEFADYRLFTAEWQGETYHVERHFYGAYEITKSGPPEMSNLNRNATPHDRERFEAVIEACEALLPFNP